VSVEDLRVVQHRLLIVLGSMAEIWSQFRI